jgi:hypothetical protein
MKATILAISLGAVLAGAMLIPALSSNVQAQVTSESRVLQAILGLTQVAKGKSEALVATSENIEDDLLFKKKFYSLSVTGEFNDFDIQSECDFDDPSACAFNIESIQCVEADVSECQAGEVGAQCNGGVLVDQIEVEVREETGDEGSEQESETDISGKEIHVPANILLDAGMGQIGVPGTFGLEFDGVLKGTCVVTGEKPQGMRLTTEIEID